MAGSYLNSLVGSFGIESEGPDPNRLEGLLELVRMGPNEELADQLQRMQFRIQEAHRDRQAAFEDRREVLHPDVAATIERNLGACLVLDEVLGHLSEELDAESIETFERAIREFLETSDQLANLANSSVPCCPRCGSQGPENLCASCQLDRLIPDPDVTDMEYTRAVVGEEFLAVYQAYAGVVEGQSNLEPLLQALQALEFSLLEAQALAEQAAEDSPPHEALLKVINDAVEGINRMHAVQENRLTRELHQGWAQVFMAAAVVPQLLPSQESGGASNVNQEQGKP